MNIWLLSLAFFENYTDWLRTIAQLESNIHLEANKLIQVICGRDRENFTKVHIKVCRRVRIGHLDDVNLHI